MPALFELIPTTVRNYPPIHDVKLADRPSVEPRLDEDVIKRRFISNLQVAAAKAQSTHTEVARNCA